MTERLMNAKDVPDRAEKSPAHIVFAARKKGEEIQRQGDRDFERLLFDIYTEALHIATTRPATIIEAQTGQKPRHINWPSFVWNGDYMEHNRSDNPCVNHFVGLHAYRVRCRMDLGHVSTSIKQRLTEHFSAVMEVKNV